MKKLTTEELYFLMGLENVVTQELKGRCKLLLDIEGDYKGLRQDYQNYKKDRISKLFLLLFCNLLFLIMIAFLTLSSGRPYHSSTWVTIIIMAMMSIHIIRFARHTQSQFTKQINALQEVLRTYGHKELRHVDYFLNRPWSWFCEEAEWILTKLGNRLLQAEKEEGESSSLANQFRKEFKSCHAIFVQFSLCDEGQGKWLDPKRNIPTLQTAKEAIEAIVEK